MLLEELDRREAAAREEIAELRGQFAELTRRLAENVLERSSQHHPQSPQTSALAAFGREVLRVA
jgi:hypothetical protein